MTATRLIIVSTFLVSLSTFAWAQGMQGGMQSGGMPGGRMGPPQEAFSACNGKAQGDACSFQTPRGDMNGTCGSPPQGGKMGGQSGGGQSMVCMPQGIPGQGGGMGGSMGGGQMVDITSEGRRIPLPELEALHIHKTGALILSCLRMACCAKLPLDAAQSQALDHYGKAVGLAYQIQDDVLDEESSTEQLGKTQGKDRAQEKSTYVALLGLAEAKQRAADLFDDARRSLSGFGDDGALLSTLADVIQQRRN